MSNKIVLNHVSLPFSCKKGANEGLLTFFKVLKDCQRVGLRLLLVDESQDKSLMRLELAAGYFIQDWYESSKKDSSLLEWCRFLKSVETKQPVFEEVEVHIKETVEVGLHKEEAGRQVFLAAFHLETFLISFATQSCWMQPQINIWIVKIDSGAQSEEGSLRNLYNQESFEAHGEILRKKLNEELCFARDLWEKREEYFPHLIFLDPQIGTALGKWSARQDILMKARDALYILEEFCAKWKSSEYTEYRHEYLRDLGLAAQVSGESASVNNDPKKKQKRTFWLKDGRQVYCENHIKLPDSYRMHFYPEMTEKRIYVAYLGPHLPL